MNKVCQRCVMDSSIKEVKFDDKGFCNFCSEYEQKFGFGDSTIRVLSKNFEKFHSQIKNNRDKRKYDCVIGLSGGVDSSYALMKAVENGLNPIAVHLDNGWDSSSAQYNIKQLVTILNVDLITHVIDWDLNRKMQLALIHADVIDIEIIMDNAMATLNYQTAKKFGIKYILSGTNTATEGISHPSSWSHYKFDMLNIKTIMKKFGNLNTFNTHPLMGTLDWLLLEYFHKIKWVKYLDYFAYDKELAIQELKHKFNYKTYKNKHGESVFTRFYQNYILPVKFGVDKRKTHYSNLICSGQLDRVKALKDLSCNDYINSEEFYLDREFALKKLKISKDDFESYLLRPPVSHNRYKSEKLILDLLVKGYNILKIFR